MFALGIPTFTADLTEPVSRRVPAYLHADGIETVTVPIDVADEQVVSVSLDGGNTWRVADRIPGGIQFRVLGERVDSIDGWKIPAGTQVWVWAKVGVDGGLHVRQSFQPIQAAGTAPTGQIVVEAPPGADVLYGHGVPGELEGDPGSVYIDLDTGIVYEWSV